MGSPTGKEAMANRRTRARGEQNDTVLLAEQLTVFRIIWLTCLFLQS